MKSEALRKQHYESFARLSISERLNWAFEHGMYFRRFMDDEAKRINKRMRRHGKKYFGE